MFLKVNEILFQIVFFFKDLNIDVMSIMKKHFL
jgi:hypothetical protein